MPCYDKKLEASRQDFYNDVYSTRDVDCVITTGELELMMREKGWDLSVPVEGEDQDRLAGTYDSQVNVVQRENEMRLPELIDHPGTSSGSYLHSLISAITHESPSALELTVCSVRAPDYEEYILTEKATGAVIFRGAKCYGFRNLQNLVRKVGREAGVQVGRGAAGRMAGIRGRAIKKKADGMTRENKRYDYVEVMACPGGCVNGGGQLRPPAQPENGTDEEGFQRDWETSGVKLDDEDVGRIQGQSAKWGDKEWTKKVELAYWHDLPTPSPSPTPNGALNGLNGHADDKALWVDRLAIQILAETCHSKLGQVHSWATSMDDASEELRRKHFRTQYRAVESEVVGLAVKW
jgi:iron only hydrogenase large subunit-like protein